MASNEKKQTHIKEKYINNIKNYREVYEERKEFLKGWTLPTYKKRVATATSETSADTSGEPTASNVKLTGKMPTAAQYGGPDSTKRVKGGVYQTGLKAKLAGTDKWNDKIHQYCTELKGNPLLTKCIMATESGGNHSNKPNGSNCVGLMQIRYDDAIAMKWDWNKVKNDPDYNLKCGIKWLKEKQDYAARVIKNAGSHYQGFKRAGYTAENNIRGCGWFYYGFTTADYTGLDNGLQIEAMYKGFGGNPNDTAHMTNVLGSSSGSSSSSSSSESKKEKTISRASTETAEIITPSLTRPPLSEEEKEFLIESVVTTEKTLQVLVNQYSITPPTYERVQYMKDMEFSLDKTQLIPISNPDIIHISGPVENLYQKNSVDAFLLLKRKLGFEKLMIVRGYDPNSSETSHAVGIAMDIFASTPFEALFIADTAWLAGFRAIAIGPKFVHVDTGPTCTWHYEELPIYRGPGTLKVSDLQDGY